MLKLPLMASDLYIQYLSTAYHKKEENIQSTGSDIATLPPRIRRYQVAQHRTYVAGDTDTKYGS